MPQIFEHKSNHQLYVIDKNIKIKLFMFWFSLVVYQSYYKSSSVKYIRTERSFNKRFIRRKV